MPIPEGMELTKMDLIMALNEANTSADEIIPVNRIMLIQVLWLATIGFEQESEKQKELTGETKEG